MDIQNSSRRQKLIPLLSGLAVSLLVCGVPLVYMVLTGRFQQLTQPFANAAQTVVVAPVSSEPPQSIVPIVGTSTLIVASLPFSERFNIADPYISEAIGYMFQGSHAEAILAWDKALEIVPDYAEGHYQRGQSYLSLLQNQRSQEEFMLYLSRAGEDFDKAIELAPYHKGDYYYGRFKYYDALASNQPTRADYLHLEQIALDNLLIANRLGNFQKDSETKLALVYIAVGKCDEGIEQANRLIAETNEPSVDIIGSLAIGYLCKNDLPKALEYMDQVVKIVDNCFSRFDRARILYAMGRLNDALVDLDYTLAKDPNYCGIRYYLRGLIYAEKGELDKAQDDLYFGIGQTWERGGLLSYAQGKIALAQGDKGSAIQYFQDAETTYSIHDPILTKIQNDLAALGASSIEVTPSFPFVTAIPKPTALLTPRPTSSPVSSVPTPPFTPDPIVQFANILDIEKTIGPITVGLNFDGLWRFQPAQSLDHREVQKLSVWVISSDTVQRLPRQLFVWNFRNNMWGGVDELKWGENRLEFQNEYVSPDGDVIVHFFNQDNTLETTIDTLGITLIIQRTDGSVEVHGITP
jgi:tetratricopeptide (TPR) repeat protein